jgi:hypothetical protein
MSDADVQVYIGVEITKEDLFTETRVPSGCGCPHKGGDKAFCPDCGSPLDQLVVSWVPRFPKFIQYWDDIADEVNPHLRFTNDRGRSAMVLGRCLGTVDVMDGTEPGFPPHDLAKLTHDFTAMRDICTSVDISRPVQLLVYVVV